MDVTESTILEIAASSTQHRRVAASWSGFAIRLGTDSRFEFNCRTAPKMQPAHRELLVLPGLSPVVPPPSRNADHSRTVVSNLILERGAGDGEGAAVFPNRSLRHRLERGRLFFVFPRVPSALVASRSLAPGSDLSLRCVFSATRRRLCAWGSVSLRRIHPSLRFEVKRGNEPSLKTKETNMKNKPQPIHEIRLGAVKAAIWENQHAGKTWLNVTFSRLYKDGDDWKSTDSFGRDDLPLLMKVADQVHTWSFTHKQPDKEAKS